MAKVSIPKAELNRFDLPPVCLITGSTEGVTFRPRKLLWTPPWVYLLIFIPMGGLPLAFVVSLLVRRRVDAELPFSEKGWTRFRQATWFRPLSVLVLLCGWLGALMLLASESDAMSNFAGVFVILFLAIPIAVYVATRKWVVSVGGITKTHVDLRCGSDEAAQRIRAHLRGRPAPQADVLHAAVDASAA